MAINVTELDKGSWVIFELPGFTSANAGTPQDSVDALRNASSNAYYRGESSLWVKLVSNGGPGRGGVGGVGGVGGGSASVQVSR